MGRVTKFRLVAMARTIQRSDSHIALAPSFRHLTLTNQRPSIVENDKVEGGSLRGKKVAGEVICLWTPHPFHPDQKEPLWASQVAAQVTNQPRRDK